MGFIMAGRDLAVTAQAVDSGLHQVVESLIHHLVDGRRWALIVPALFPGNLAIQWRHAKNDADY